ncbi:glycosyltransferase family 4 protein [Amycolatopsis sp. FDAARGOS 1241]|uniref:glycosyltransferase family 4 protein n=1 Tax=Amycolatopsis sp. FDAARGOS 1241 TaxID=2778070 RepID=UPI0019500E0A|nr:glycosyltransferase family 4 protein [Amycolatopsis sp. FDAARGOS 1241]QRP45452.1 glycosyltransferase family 4 protein [Amycolatopsis sp. FDAARGOS 1241]
MKVLVVHNRYRSEQPSGENNVVDAEVALLSAGGVQVGLFERRSDDIAAMSLPGKASVPLQVPWNRSARAALAARLRVERPDVVHVHNTFPLLSPSVLAACADARVPVVATLHNYGLVCPPGTLYRDGKVCTDCVGGAPVPAVRHGCYRGSAVATLPMAVNLLLNRARWRSGVTRFFCISAAQRRVLVDAGMPVARMTVKHNFVTDPGVRRSGDGEHVLFLGRLTPEKGVPLLMAAWDLLGGALGLPLVIAGTGPLSDEVSAWASSRSDVSYVGLRDKDSCRALTASAAAVVAPSAWLEAFGLVVVEAMAAGVPTVAPAHGAFPELISDGVTGVLHAPDSAAALADALRDVVSDRDRNRKMGEAARHRYDDDFTPEVGFRRLIEGYEAAIAAHGSA